MTEKRLEIHETVRERYARIAEGEVQSCCGPSSCCGGNQENEAAQLAQSIGVDMTPEMLSKARRNLEVYREQSGLDNVEFRLGEIEHLPVADASVDVVISNCVINLSPDKPQV